MHGGAKSNRLGLSFVQAWIIPMTGRYPTELLRLRAGLAAIATAVLATACSEPQPAAPPTPQVEVVTVEKRTVPVVVSRVAQTESSREVQVVARVSGFLERIAYDEGTLLQEGDAMFEMDRKPFLAEVKAAEGELEASKARLWTANANLDRTRPLAEADALSQADLDRAIGEQKAAEAAVYAAQARLTKANLDLSYTTIHSPVTGLSGKARQREGAYLNAFSESANLSFVAQIDPIWVNFSISQNERERFLAQESSGEILVPEDRQYEFEIVLADGEVYPHKGTLDFAAPTFDERTGTFSARAVVDNPDFLLRPGMFVTARMRGLQRPDAVVVPKRAVQQTSNGQVVWVVGDDSTAVQRPVRMGDWIGGDWVVEEGLSGGERVIVGGFQRVRPGIRVNPVAPSSGGATPGPTGKTG
jgi:membrane fusion protein (multidrug efflux system)